MPVPEILRPPNLASLFRIALVPLLWYLLAQPGEQAMLWAALVMIAAGLSDGLDGWLARRMNMVGSLGVALDPIADKVFAGALGILLLFYRDFPLWLAGLIVGRDLLIMGAGIILLRGRDITLPSNLTGKYAFGAIAFLLASYVIRFPFGIELFTWLTVALIIASLVSYGRVFTHIIADRQPPRFNDRPLFWAIRLILSAVVFAIYFVMLYRHLYG
jgi:CDP-diacylglycerol--glycerol-3-phosphate 3-phosphatidyltransferase